MPLPTPNDGESEDEFVSRCMGDDVMKKEFPDQKQRVAVCYRQYRKEREILTYSEPIPILRAFEHEGQRYVYGYGAIFDSPDSFGTVMTKEVAVSSEDRLRRFPAVRWMHREPLGQIIFDQEIKKGIKTYIDDHGFHILFRVYPDKESEWRMMQEGNWGLSWGLAPVHDGIQQRKLADGKFYPCFVKGTIYEFSVVDSPSHPDAVAYVMQRMIAANHSDLGDNVTQEPHPANLKTGSKKNMEKAEVEQMLKEFETRLLGDIAKQKETAAKESDFKAELKAVEDRIMSKIIAATAKEDEVKKSIEDVQKKVEDFDGQITHVNSLISEMRAIGQDTSGLEQTRKHLESAKTEIMNTLKRTIDGIDKRLKVIENAPEEHSPASMGTRKSVVRGIGFAAMLEAATTGGE